MDGHPAGAVEAGDLTLTGACAKMMPNETSGMSDSPLEQSPPSQPAPHPPDPSDGIGAEHGTGVDRELAAALDSFTAEDLERIADSAPAGEQELAPGSIHAGRVIQITAEDVLLEFGSKQQGVIPLMEFAGQKVPIVGDDLSVLVERFNPTAGLYALSKQQADQFNFWQTVQPGDELEGVVTGMNKGGLDVDIGGARAFLPASQVDVRRVKDISTFIGEHVRCVVSQVDRTTQDLVLSRRKLQEKEADEKRRQLLDALVEGETRTGTVARLAEFGAFVDLGGIDGLIHLNDLTWGRVRHPREVVQEGQEVQVSVLRVDREKGKISLGLKQVKPDPWENVEAKYPPGSRVSGRVLRLADFGAFVELEEGVEALLPLSEMSWSRHVNSPAEVVKPGDVVQAVVLRADGERRRISIGLKQAEENPWNSVASEFPVNVKVTGKVTKLMDFGAFVELTPGVEGLIHISELSERRVRAVSDVVQEGQEVEVRVIKVDTEANRISLSMRPEPVARAEPVAAAGGKDKSGKQKRKRPLRGGLSSHFEW